MFAPLRRLPIALSSVHRRSAARIAPTRLVSCPSTGSCAIAYLAPLRGRRHTPTSNPSRSAVDLLSLSIVALVSIGIAYLATPAYTTETDPLEDEQLLENHTGASVQPEEQPLEMASQIPPGRPGNLTADQEEKLKQMWAQLNELCGVSSSPAPQVERPSTADSTTDEVKKKRRSRLSLFGKKDKDDVDTSDDDKHGQKKEYQQALASMTPQQLRESMWSMVKHDDPDALNLRFLRARKWDVQAAIVMLISTMHWRAQEAHVDDDIMLHGEAHALAQSQSSDTDEKKTGEDFLAQLRMGKSFVHGFDKENRPCCYCRVRLHHQGEQSVKSLERFTIYTIETSRMLLRPPVDTATVVFDMTDFSMANMDYTPVKFMIKVFEANYPESLGSVLVYKAPWVFQGVWRIIKGWLDPVVASKIHFASNVTDLEEWVPRSRIPKEMGGDEDWVYRYIEPRSDENKAFTDLSTRDAILEERKQLVQSYEAATLGWIAGSDDGAARPQIAQRLAENYWRLDPYIRARSLYDRLGVLGPGGKLNFYPASVGNAGNGASTVDDGVD